MPVVARDRGLTAPLAAALAGAAVVAVIAALRAGGQVSYASHPLATLALAGAAVLTMLVRERLSRAQRVGAAAAAGWLSGSILLYLALTAWALWAVSAGHPVAPVAVALWNAAWLPPLALSQLTVSYAVRAAGRRRPRTHVALLTMTSLAVVATMVLSHPTDPFAGVPTIAPEAWQPRLEPLGAAITLLTAGAFLLLPASLWRAASTSQGVAGARLGIAAAGTSAAPLTIAFCLLLALARDPGQVAPSLGSVAFLLALAGAAVVSGVCALLAARDSVAPRHLTAAVRVSGLATAGLLVVASGTLLAAPGAGLAPTGIAIAVPAVTVLLLGGGWYATGRLSRALVPDPGVVDDPPAGPSGGPTVVPGLTARESEILGLVAEGASNIGIADQLVISRRTVDAHMRAILTKLDLRADGPGSNTRVRAARIYLEHARTGTTGPRSAPDR